MNGSSMRATETALVSEGVTLASEDLVEAVSAFREKRPGTYVGR
jgi:hypothetical protein